MKAWAAALLMLVGSTIAFLQYGIPWFVYGALYYSILAIPILLFDGLRLAAAFLSHAPMLPQPPAPLGTWPLALRRSAPLLRWQARPCVHQIPCGAPAGAYADRETHVTGVGWNVQEPSLGRPPLQGCMQVCV
jgi:hypothetical protein